MNKLRLRYNKMGKTKFISHLDLSSVMRRAIIRAGIKLRYSEGFNPHPYMSVALPLSVGMQSRCELMDVGILERLETDGFADTITNYLPEGLNVEKAYYPERKFADIAWVEIFGMMYYDIGVSNNTLCLLKERFAHKNIEVAKKTKRGVVMLNISDYMRDIEFFYAGANAVEITAKISAQNPTLSPINLMDSLTGQFSELAPDFFEFTRREVLDASLTVFR